VTFDLKAGDVRYVHMYVGMGLLVGRLHSELVDASVGQKDIEGLSYIGDPLKQ
jgi:hypothetical protein